MTDEELVALIEREEKLALGYYGSDLTDERAEALKRYLGEPYGNEVEGRSQVVSRDVLETIEWCMPSLLKMFVGGDEVVRFDPQGPEDVEPAEMESAYLNHIVTQQNNAYQLFYTWFKDAMLEKNGYTKAVWETREEHEQETYQGLSDDEMAMLLQDPEIEVVAHEETVEVVIDPMAGQYEDRRHTLVVRCKKTYGQVQCYNLPVEEVLVSPHTTGLSLAKSPFVQHRTRKTLSEIRQMGYDVPDDIAGEESTDDRNAEWLARRQYTEEQAQWAGESDDPAQREVLLRETYIRTDVDGDGIAELIRALVVGHTILDQQEWDAIPIYAISPNPMPHRHVGLSEADLVMDLQEIRTVVMRQFLDNLYLANNGRYGIDANRVNLQDMLTARPGGIVRVEGAPGDAIFPMVHPNTTGIAIQGLEYLDTVKENRTGVTKYNQGLDSQSLNKTATGISQIMNAASQRIEMIARHFAETGVKELFQGAHALIRKHQKSPLMFQLRQQWAPIDPREWKKRTSLTIAVGLGTSNKDAQLQHLITILQAQKEGLAIGVATPQNVYHALVKLTQNAGFKDAESFWSDPSQQPPQEPQPDPEIEKEKIKADVQMQSKQMDMQAEAMKGQISMQADAQKFQAEMAMKQQQFEAEMAQKWQEFQVEMQMKREEMAMTHELRREEMAHNASMKQQQMERDSQHRMMEMGGKNDER